jgi:hypothetical protein
MVGLRRVNGVAAYGNLRMAICLLGEFIFKMIGIT